MTSNREKMLIVALAITLLVGTGLLLSVADKTPEAPSYDRWYIIKPTKHCPNFYLFDKEAGALYVESYSGSGSEKHYHWTLHLPPPTPPTTTQPAKK